jgi:predicted RecB family nuclease
MPVNRTITSEILVAYSQCPQKAFLIFCTDENGIPHEYVRILERHKKANRRIYLSELNQKMPHIQDYDVCFLQSGSDMIINATLRSEGLEAGCDLLTKVEASSSLGEHSYEPTICVGTHSVSKEQRLELFFAGYVLGQIQGKVPTAGRIIVMGQRLRKVKLENSGKTLMPLLEDLREWAAASSPESPPLILNKHCPLCRFYSLCRAKAEQEDHLSLLDRISTPKAVQRYEKKGIFTIKQLSYLYKPRRRKKRTRNPPKPIYKPELQALAIRTGRIYLQELPELYRQPVELFLDIEGIPDQQLFYLIGLLVCEADTSEYHSYWADSPDDETRIWQQFLAKVNEHPDAPIYHYGSYEPRALAKLSRRYDTDGESLKSRLVNVNAYIHAKVYFPVRSNRLKEIGDFIGASWTSPDASGLQSLVWRHRWDETQDAQYYSLLVTYNREDCQALKALTDELSKIVHSANTATDVDFVNHPKRVATETGNQVHGQFETILRFAYSDYDKKKISFRQEELKLDETRESAQPKVRRPRRKKAREVTRTVRIPQMSECPECENQPLKETKRITENVVVDLAFAKHGVQKTVTRYWATKGLCPECRHYHNPPNFNVHGCPPLYGRGFKVWVTYQRLALRSSYQNIRQMIEDLFGESLCDKLVLNYLKDFARFYSETERILIHRMLQSPFLHVDETKINIQGRNQYVWVFTDGKGVVFKLTETRRATIVHEFLTDYNGVLISDFYPGYDSAKCRQQKCWVHLIRDINNDLWAAPFDTEFEELVLAVRDLIIPIMECVQEHGLKQRYLGRFRAEVNEFYADVVFDRQYRSEFAVKYQQRFARYRDSLFTFLDYDGIPWHNNTAESAIRHIALQRKISGAFHESMTHDYLILLGIKQSCRFQGKSFLEFLLSEEKDIDQFK